MIAPSFGIVAAATWTTSLSQPVVKMTWQHALLPAPANAIAWVLCSHWTQKRTGTSLADAWHLQLTLSPSEEGVYRFLTWFIICKDFVPISLYVSLEMVQFCQAIFMGWDEKMSVVVASPDSAAKAERMFARVQTARLNEELAQVHYVFSDKTGTLTQNSMNFKKCVIGSEVYGHSVTARPLHANPAPPEESEQPHVDFSKDDRKHMLAEMQTKAQGEAIAEFMYCLALNNTIFPRPTDGEATYDLTDVSTPAFMQMDSSSPDEKALGYFAQYLGYEIFSRQAKGAIKVRVKDPNTQEQHFEEFDDVGLLDFTSKRKRMVRRLFALFERALGSLLTPLPLDRCRSPARRRRSGRQGQNFLQRRRLGGEEVSCHGRGR
jgi:magnesium-transporting ATPase (P-type)